MCFQYNVKNIDNSIDMQVFLSYTDPISYFKSINFIRLRSLVIWQTPNSENNILDLKPISNISTLKTLDIRCCNNLHIENFDYISKLKNNLESLTIMNSSDIIDINSIQELSKLYGLFLIDCKISDISVLSNLTKLIKLRLVNNEIENLDSLESLINLEYLLLDDNIIEDLNPLSKLINLNTLSLSSNNIENINPICKSDFINLCHLNLSYNGIYNINDINKLPSIRSLDLTNNDIIDIKPLNKFLKDPNVLVKMCDNRFSTDQIGAKFNVYNNR